MIDFRYHLVSIIAVFLALAIGLVVGSTALSGAVETALKTELNRVKAQDATIRKSNQSLTNQVNAAQAFASVASPRLLDGLLAGQNVILVVAPGASSQVTSGVTTALNQAGAKVTGQVNLTAQYMQPTGANEDQLTSTAQDLAAQFAVTLPHTAANPAVAGQQDVAAILAAAVLDSKGSAMPTSASQAVLSQLSQAGFITGMSAPTPAGLAVLVTPSGSPPPPSSGSASQVMLVVAQELKAASSSTVMAGDIASIGSGSAIDLENNVGQVSTVDNANTESGQIIVAWALARGLEGKSPGQYSIGNQTVPSPAPTPTSTGSVASTAQPGGHS